MNAIEKLLSDTADFFEASAKRLSATDEAAYDEVKELILSGQRLYVLRALRDVPGSGLLLVATGKENALSGGDILAAPLSVLGLTTRSYNALVNRGIRTVGDLVAKTPAEIARWPGIGSAVLADIKAKLNANDLPLRESGRP